MFSLGREPQERTGTTPASRGAATDTVGIHRGSGQVQGQDSESAIRGWDQVQQQDSGKAVRV